MGRKARPVNVILLDGRTHLTKAQIEERRQAESRVKSPSDKVRCPQWLDKEGRKEWRRIYPELKALDLLTNVDVSTLAIYCDAVSRYIEATKDIQARGFIERPPVAVSASEAEEVVNPGAQDAPKSEEVVNPSVLVAVRYGRLVKAYLVEFGLSPSARAKLRPPAAKGEGPVSEFEKRFGAV